MTATGEKVQGWVGTNGVVDSNGPVGDITIPVGTLRPASATTAISFDMNLNAAASAGPPADTFAGSIEVYDSLGVSHIVSVNFTKSTNPGEWNYSVSIPNSDVTAPVTPVTGTINFDTSGKLVNPPVTGPFPALAVSEEHWPSRIVERAELERLLAQAIEKMPYVERTVLGLYYHEELTLREIAKVVKLHESRVSQLKSQAILRLRAYLEKRWPMDRGL